MDRNGEIDFSASDIYEAVAVREARKFLARHSKKALVVAPSNNDDGNSQFEDPKFIDNNGFHFNFEVETPEHQKDLPRSNPTRVKNRWIGAGW